MTPELIRRLYEAEQFDSWEEAFDCCRERDRPMDVRVPTDAGMEIAEIFPSGRGRTLYAAEKPAHDDRNFHQNPCDTLAG